MKAEKKKKDKNISETPAYLIPLLALLKKPKDTDNPSDEDE